MVYVIIAVNLIQDRFLKVGSDEKDNIINCYVDNNF